VFVAHPHLEIIDDERREGGYFLALAWQRATRPADPDARHDGPPVLVAVACRYQSFI
jgi:hypothetical protein